MKISKHKKGGLYHQYDRNFHTIFGHMLRLDGSVKDVQGCGSATRFCDCSTRKKI